MKSIRRQLTVWLVGGIVLLSLAAGSWVYLHTRAALLVQFDSGLCAKARALSAMVEFNSSGELKFESRASAMTEFNRAADEEYFEIWRQDGSVLERSPSLATHDLGRGKDSNNEQACWDIPLPDGRLGRAAQYRFTPTVDEEESGNHKSRNAAKAQRSPQVSLTVAQSREGMDQLLSDLLVALVLAGGAMAAGGALLVAVVVRRGLAPVRTVAKEAEGIQSNSLHYRFSVNSMPVELQPICNRLNDVLERLQNAFDRERRFTADVSHELRTPIAELRTLAEVALKWPEPARSASAFEDALAIARQMETVVTTLLAIARANSVPLVPTMVEVDLVETIHERCRSFEAQANEKSIEFQLDLPRCIQIRTDASLLRAILGSVLENAVDYTPALGRIEIHLVGNAESVELSVTNSAIGLSEPDLSHLFEPFWRKDISRSDSSHSGLGLALVAAYAKVLGISLRVDLPLPGQFRISLCFSRTDPGRAESNLMPSGQLSIS